MDYGELLHRFFEDDKVLIALVVIALDFLLGVVAAFKAKNFRLSYLADFARNDVLFKLVPYFVVYSGAVVAGQQEIVIPGLDLGVIAGAFYVGIIAAWVGSIISSLGELGFPIPGVPTASSPAPVTEEAFRGENAGPPKA